MIFIYDPLLISNEKSSKSTDNSPINSNIDPSKKKEFRYFIVSFHTLISIIILILFNLKIFTIKNAISKIRNPVT